MAGAQPDSRDSIVAELTAAGFCDARVIGRGGFGVVYRCSQRDLERDVAVKVLTADLSDDDRRRFVREQHAMGRLSGHPNIISLLQAGATSSGCPYIVMPYHRLGSLDGQLRRGVSIEWVEVLRLGVKLAGALDTAHQLGILHRDVKPANVLLTEYGEPQLSDFGIAHYSGGFETEKDMISGSLAFTAPEIFRGEEPTPASDVYSLGATMFCLISGRSAFARRNGEGMPSQVLRITSQPVPICDLKDVPDDVGLLIKLSMSGNPQERPVTAEMMGELIQKVQHQNNLPAEFMNLGNKNRGSTRYIEYSKRSNFDHGVEMENIPFDISKNEKIKTRRVKPSFAPSENVRENNIGLELTSFIGRRREIKSVRQQMATSRLVTITGIGGIGKSRLALRVASDSRRAFSDGVWLTDLGQLKDEVLVAEAIMATFGVKKQDIYSPEQILAGYLSSRHLLLVLDNCEHILNSVSNIVNSLLKNCPELHIIATSRERLGVAGEAVVSIPPLTLPDLDIVPDVEGLSHYEGLALFAERASAALPGFALNARNAVDVIYICQRLDGLPLAIELAAARLRAMSTAQIRDRLSDRYKLLTLGVRGAPSRQQTLRLCIDWSYELCTFDEQRFWARLSVFAGGFELDAAEVICGEGTGIAEVDDMIGSLVDKSILIRNERGGATWYRMMESLVQYGKEKLRESGEYIEHRKKHCYWYENLAVIAKSQWISERQSYWVDRLEREIPNLRNAMEYSLENPDEVLVGLRIATTLKQFWFAKGLFAEARRWIDRALDASDDIPSELRIEALCFAGLMAASKDNIEAAELYLDRAQNLALLINSKKGSAWVSTTRAAIIVIIDTLDKSEISVAEAVEVFRDDGDLNDLLFGLLGMAMIAQQSQNLDSVLEVNREIVKLTEGFRDLHYRSHSLSVVGYTLFRKGDLIRSTEILREGLRLSQAMGDHMTSATFIGSLAWVASADSRERDASILLGARESIHHTMGYSGGFMPDLVVENLPEMVLEHDDQVRRHASKVLSSSKFDRAFRLGLKMSYNAAVSFALGENNNCKNDVSSSNEFLQLTPRERQVADLVSEGLTNKSIAEKLVISPRTAQGHVEHILNKLGFTSRSQIAAWVVAEGSN